MEQVQKNQALFGGLLVLECLFWGVGNSVTKLALESMTPFFCLAFRFLGAFCLFLALYYREFAATIRLNNLYQWLPVCLFTSAAFILATLSLVFTTATIAGFLMSLSVMFTPFLAYFMLDKPFHKSTLFVVGIVVSGMYFLAGNEGGFVFGLGELLALLSALSFAVSLIYSSKYVSHLGVKALSTAQAGFTAVLSLGLALLLEDVHILPQVSAQAWGSIAYLAIAGTFLAYILQNISLKHVSAVFASLALCTEPIFTAIAARIILGERLTPIGLAGGALIMLGLFFASFLQSQRAGEGLTVWEESTAK